MTKKNLQNKLTKNKDLPTLSHDAYISESLKESEYTRAQEAGRLSLRHSTIEPFILGILAGVAISAIIAVILS